ncbi:MAG TPA: NAD(P)-dependent oxidoreductase [Chloroflexota bacterium]|nr:NAD(P)-dependent oxidoreductase [Chloroflexota bacterium]
MQTIGVVGAGAMGTVIVQRFVAAGRRVLVYDVAESAVARAVALGATAAPSPAELAAQADSVSVMVRTDAQMLDAVLGSEGLLHGAPPGAVLLLHSTIHPRTTRRIGDAARARDVEVADACLGGMPDVLRAGQAVCFAGGDAALVARVTPHLLLLVRQVIHMGPLGCGNVAKVVRNLVNLTDQLILHEGLLLASAAGIQRSRAVEIARLIYASRLEAEDMRIDPNRPAGNLFDTILPLARDLADELHVSAPLTRYLAAADPRLDV